jgi:hypothetical protein
MLQRLICASHAHGRSKKFSELYGNLREVDCYLPEKTWEQRLWLRAFMSRGAENPDFAYWIARNVLMIHPH